LQAKTGALTGGSLAALGGGAPTNGLFGEGILAPSFNVVSFE